MECDKSLKPTPDPTCFAGTLNVSRFATGVITEVTPHRDGWQIEGLADQYAQWCMFFTTDADTANVKPGMRFELEGDAIKIFTTDGN
jgi:hypothetical protein